MRTGRIQTNPQASPSVRFEAQIRVFPLTRITNEFYGLSICLMNFVFTVCDNAASEVCPVWPGQPITALWGVPDPAAVAGTPQEIDRAFSQAFSILERRITLMLSLPLASLDIMALKNKLDAIGKK
jgi:arsenate reductase